jgi:hypothetical protein
MPKDKPEIVICQYTCKDGKQKEFEKLLASHWPTLKKLKLVDEDEKPQYYRGKTKEGKLIYVEIYAWINHAAVQRAHELPDLMAVWEPMGQVCEDMRFPHVERFTPGT